MLLVGRQEGHLACKRHLQQFAGRMFQLGLWIITGCKCQTPQHGHRLRTCCTTHQRTSSQQFYNLLYNKLKFITNGPKFAKSQRLDMSGCWALALRCGKFVVQVVELLWARPLVAGVRVVEFGTNEMHSWRTVFSAVAELFVGFAARLN